MAQALESEGWKSESQVCEFKKNVLKGEGRHLLQAGLNICPFL